MSKKKILIIGAGIMPASTVKSLEDNGATVLAPGCRDYPAELPDVGCGECYSRISIVEEIKVMDEKKYYQKERILQSHLSQCLTKQGGRKQKKRYPNR